MSTNSDTTIRIKSQLIQKHDLEVNWNKATSFVPYKGQLIVYDIEVDKDGNTLKDTEGNLLLPEGRFIPYTYERIKIGDGINIVSDLPFVDEHIQNAINALNTDAIINVLALPTDNIEENKIYNISTVFTMCMTDENKGVNDYSYYIKTIVVEQLPEADIALPGMDFDSEKYNFYYCLADNTVYVNITAEVKANSPITEDCPLGWVSVEHFGRGGKYDAVASTSIFTWGGVITDIDNYTPETAGIYNLVVYSGLTALYYRQNGEWIPIKTIIPGTGLEAEIFNSRKNIASGDYSHAEGYGTNASGGSSHTEGTGTEASGDSSHAEGSYARATGSASHAEGLFTTASGEAQHAQGKYNIEDTSNTYAHIVGNGTGLGSENRSNAHTLDWAGNAWFAGDVYVGCTATTNTNKDAGSKKLATEDQVAAKLDIYNNTTAARQVYGTVNGQQIMVPVSTAEYTASALVSRDANGYINTKTPVSSTQATNKQYVDDLIATNIKYNDVIQNTNPFGGKKLYINSVDNAFAAINKKFWVKITYHKCIDANGVEYPHVKEGAAKTDADYWVDGPSAGSTLDFGNSGIDELFNSTYEGGKRIPLNSYMKVHIRFSNDEGWTPLTGTAINRVYGSYPYGTFYISYYYQNRPSTTKRSHYRCYNNGSTHGYGWKKLNFSIFNQNTDGKTNTIESCADEGNNARTCMEFIIFSDDTVQAGPTEIEWKLSRPTFSQNSPLLHNYSSNNVYYNMYFRTKKTQEANISLTPEGVITAKTIVATNAPTGATHVTNKQYVDDAITTKTSVTIGKAHQAIFDADTKLDKITSSGNVRFYSISANGTNGVYPVATSPAAVQSSYVPLYWGKNSTSQPADTEPVGQGVLVTSSPTKPYHCATKKYVDDNFIAKVAESQTITGNLAIIGNLQVQGTTETVDAVTYKIENNVIEFNPDKIHNKNWLTGLAINKGRDGETDLGTYGIMYDPSTDAVKLGFGQVDEENKFKFNVNESAPIATREEFNKSWEDDAIFVFDKTTKKFKYSGKTLSGFKKEIQDEMKDYVAKYIETYMSTVIEENDAGGETLDINIDNYTEENGTLIIGG